MEPSRAAELALLTVGTGVIVLSTLGVVSGRTAFDKLHFTGPTTVLGIPLLAIAILVSDGFTTSGVMACLVGFTTLCLGPISTHVIGRALRVRSPGGWPATDQERRRGGGR